MLFYWVAFEVIQLLPLIKSECLSTTVDPKYSEAATMSLPATRILYGVLHPSTELDKKTDGLAVLHHDSL